MTDKQWDDAIETADISGTTKEEQQEIIYVLTVRRIIETLRDPEMAHRPSTITQAQRFLRDNDIQGFDIPGSASRELTKAMEARAPFQLTGTDE